MRSKEAFAYSRSTGYFCSVAAQVACRPSRLPRARCLGARTENNEGIRNGAVSATANQLPQGDARLWPARHGCGAQNACRSAQVSSKTTSCGAAKPSRNGQNNENDERIRKSRSLPTGNAWRALNADPPDTDLFVRWCGRGGVARHPRALRRSLTAASGIRSLTSARAWPKCAGACGDAC
jgi:hypothetical protein